MNFKTATAGLLALFALPFAWGLEYSTTNNFVVTPEQQIETEHWVYAVTARVDGVVKSDIFILGQEVDLNGGFSNDVWAVGTKVSFDGDARDQVRLGGQTAKVSGKARGGLTVAGDTIKCNDSTECGRDLFLAGNDVIYGGSCAGDARIMGNRVTVEGDFGGDIRIIANDIVVSPRTSIEGDLIYTSPKELYLQKGVALNGELVRKASASSKPTSMEEILSYLFTQSLWFLAAVMVGIPFIYLFPPIVVESLDAIRKSAWRCLLVGIAAFILVPLFAAIIFGSLVGIPLSLIILGFYGILLYLAKYPVALLFGSLILRMKVARSYKDVLFLLLTGLLAIYILISLPVFGGTIQFVITIYGLGALVSAILKRRKTTVVAIDRGKS